MYSLISIINQLLILSLQIIYRRKVFFYSHSEKKYKKQFAHKIFEIFKIATGSHFEYILQLKILVCGLKWMESI